MSLIETRKAEGTSAAALSGFSALVENPEVELLLGLIQGDMLDRAIRRLYDVADNAIQRRRIADLSGLVEGLLPSVEDSLQFAIAVMTATLPAKNELPLRSEYAARVVAALKNRGHEPTVVLRGLL